jgi:hypothetical protein
LVFLFTPQPVPKQKRNQNEDNFKIDGTVEPGTRVVAVR